MTPVTPTLATLALSEPTDRYLPDPDELETDHGTTPYTLPAGALETPNQPPNGQNHDEPMPTEP